MCAELAQYVYPKRRAVEIRQNVQPITFEIDLSENENGSAPCES
jgi:hypothetical protein